MLPPEVFESRPEIDAVPAEGFKENGAERVYIGAGIEFAASPLLGRHVARRPAGRRIQFGAGFGRNFGRRHLRLQRALCEAKICDACLAL